MEYNGIKLRHELKYYINYTEYTYLLTRLSTIMKFDGNSKENGYHIRSLYFDDIYNSSLDEKEAGIQFRQKYRIRVYNKSDDVIKLERKEKFGEFISKQSVRLSKEQFYKIINNENISFLLNNDIEMTKEMYVAIKTRFLKPAVIVDYEREVFILNEGNVRITFDKNLQAGINTADIFSKDNVITVNALEPGIMVLEVKYDDYLPRHIKKLLQIASHNRCSVSKYVICRRQQFKFNPITQYI